MGIDDAAVGVLQLIGELLEHRRLDRWRAGDLGLHPLRQADAQLQRLVADRLQLQAFQALPADLELVLDARQLLLAFAAVLLGIVADEDLLGGLLGAGPAGCRHRQRSQDAGCQQTFTHTHTLQSA